MARLSTVLDLTLYVVTDPVLVGSRSVGAVVEAALRGGATVVQLRDKDASTRALIDLARKLRECCAAAGVPLIVNDRVDVALASGADGVHLGQDDMPLGEARRLLGPDAIIGVSVRTIEEVRRAERDGSTYLAANGVCATSTKTDLGTPLGWDGLRELAAIAGLPIVAIGGITAANAARVREAGCSGIAVVSAVMAVSDPAQACRDLRRAFSGSA